jgi:hypothetical protein
MRIAGTVVLLGVPAATAAQVAQERVDLDVVKQIREEGLERSQLPAMARHLTEVIGPRLTGSPQMARANAWVAEQFESWGLEHVVIEPWGEFGRGWERVAYSGRLLSPFVQPLDAQAVAWTGSTDGTVRGPAVIMHAETLEEVEQYRGKLRNAIVLQTEPPDVEPEWTPQARRTPLDDLLAPLDAAAMAERAARMRRYEEYRAHRERTRPVREARAQLLREEGAAVLLTPSSRNFSVIRGGGNTAGRSVDGPDPIPELVVSRERYNQIYRNVQAGVPVELEINVQNRFFDDDLQEYNVLADLQGTDKASEYVMLGAHLDSWHFGGGAADNAAGSVVMMEAMRILKTLGLQPRRTIRIALWSGEEQGLLGSRNWVENHPELHAQISAYVNVDNGTGKVRGIWDQSNEQAIPVFEQLLWPFRDLGVVAVKHGDTGGTDHLAFDGAGIPGFNFIQDPIEYSVRSHHTDVDTYDNLVLEDLQQAAVVVASTVYHLAMREEMMPRKPTPPPATN